MMAAATMFKNGNLTEEQKYTKPTAGATGPEYSDVDLNAPKVGTDIRAVAGGFTSGVDTSRQRRSQDIEDVRDPSVAGQAQKGADLAYARQTRQPTSQPTTDDQARLTAQQGTRRGSRSEMAKQLGIRDIDDAMDYIMKNTDYRKGVSMLKAGMK
jgi:hypothetical protein